MKIIIFSILVVAILLFFPTLVLAKLGVGVGLGKVSIDQTLAPGGIYRLPTLPVLNTGDEPSDYEVTVTYLSEQPELQPDAVWFKFTPQSFHLAAGKSQNVEVSLTLPVNIRSGNYFAFLEAHPVKKAEGVTIGIAAATKLNFTVKPAGVLGAAVERIRSIFETNAPVSYIIVGVIGGIIILSGLATLGRKYLTVQVRLKKKTGKSGKEEV